MEYVRLGSTGLKVSRICLGCLAFGTEYEWMIEKEEADKVLKRAWDLGINFFDTSNSYSRGRSEEILGDFLTGRRNDMVIATKVYSAMGDGPNERGLSRKSIRWQSRESLRRLKTDHIDLYQIHRWDSETPIEETLSTLTDLVRDGSVNYIGASSMWAWRFAKALYLSDMKGYARFVSMQNLYNLLYREEEREMIPLCKAEGIGMIPYSPTAVGILSGRYLVDGKLRPPRESGGRISAEAAERSRYFTTPENSEIVSRVVELSKAKGATPTQVALAWLLHKGVTAPIVGTTSAEHLEDAVGALTVKLSEGDVKYMEEPYLPKSAPRQNFD